MATSLNTEFDFLLQRLLVACHEFYGMRLVSVVVFGSVGRGTPRPDSDIDFLIVAEQLPNGRIPRVIEFRAVEDRLASDLAQAHAAGIITELSPVFKTPLEIARGSPLFLDMIEDARILYDRGDVMRQTFAQFKARLDRLGARRIWRGNVWLWDLKPDYKSGEVFEL